ncbi:hypothetical protein QC864_001613 [Klebsiella pneumoniae]|nr:hypothetical protein [Klebsiella pneumoniae]
MSKRYEDLIKNARMNAECGEHMSPEEITTLLNVVEATFAALASESAGLKKFIKADCWVWDDKNEEYIDAVDCMPATPATDAYVSERGE